MCAPAAGDGSAMGLGGRGASAPPATERDKGEKRRMLAARLEPERRALEDCWVLLPEP